ncbi:ester cyclase [Actinomycetospora soli]|uniref:ester cyclase n=1 Tax=Actinomycetospora soli TaxID=2893887 RepID=UPI001E4D040F|nr:ester cyclase [Actinomycetospora soli]MCD2191267.1 ester cyclase [Actinomycetospora soli]
MSSRDDNIATQEKAAERLNAGDVDAGVDIMFAPDAVDHDPAPFQEQGREGYRRFFHYLISAFPDFTITPQRMVADDDTIAFAYTLTGTHRGEFEGVAATGRRIEVRGLQLGRFENGQIVERWGATDMASLLSRLQD